MEELIQLRTSFEQSRLGAYKDKIRETASLALASLSLLMLYIPMVMLGRMLQVVNPALGAQWLGVDGWWRFVDPVGMYGGEHSQAAYVIRSIRAGFGVPLWNPYQGLGQTLVGEGAAPTYSMGTLMRLVLPVEWWDVVFVVLLMLFSVGIYSWIRTLGAPRRSAVFVGILVGTSGFVQLWLPAASQWSALWPIGFCLALIELFRGNRVSKTNFCVSSGLLLGAGTYAGHPSAIFVLYTLVVGYGVVRLEKWSKAIVLLSAGIGTLLAAPYLGALVENTLQSGQFAAYARPRIGLADILGYLVPNVFGTGRGGPRIADINQLCNQNWPCLGQPAALQGWFLPIAIPFFWISLVSLLRRRRGIGIFCLVAVLIPILVTIEGPFTALSTAIPLLARINPIYALSAPTFIFIALAALGITQNEVWLWRRRSVLAMSLVAGVALVLVAQRTRLDPDAIAIGLPFLALGVAWISFGCMLLSLGFRSGESRMSYVAIAAASLVICGASYWPQTSIDHISWTRASVCVVIEAFLLFLYRFTATSRNSIPVVVTISILCSFGVSTYASLSLAPRTDPGIDKQDIDRVYSDFGGSGRVYGLWPFLMPNGTSQYFIQSINNQATILPNGSRRLVMNNLDPDQFPANFHGGFGIQSVDRVSPLIENVEYWRYVGLRGVVIPARDWFVNQQRLERAGYFAVDASTRGDAILIELKDSEKIAYFAASCVEVSDSATALASWEEQKKDLRTQVFLAHSKCLPEEHAKKANQVTNVVVEPNSITVAVNVNSPGYLTLVESYFPGWTVSSDAKSGATGALEINGALLGAFLGQTGNYNVKFEYQPTHWSTFRVMAFCTFVVAVLSVLLHLWVTRRPRRTIRP